MNRVALQGKDSAVERVLYMAMELSDKHGKLVFSDGGEKRRHEAMEAGHRMELVEAVKKAKEKFGLSPEAGVVSCYEAGRDGFWLHRYLVSLGIENQVVDSASIETSRRKRRAKTDRIDGVKLLTMRMRYWGGERGLWSVGRVPSVEDEEARHLHRELASLQKERTRHRNRIRGLLVAQGAAPGTEWRLSQAFRGSHLLGWRAPAFGAQRRAGARVSAPAPGGGAAACLGEHAEEPT